MRNLTKMIAAGAMSVAMTVTSFLPAGAVPMPSIEKMTNADIQQIQSFRCSNFGPCGPRFGNNYNRGNRGIDRNFNGNRNRGIGYYNGHRGYSSYRSGYRQHNGFWFPLAAFGAGALIGGAIAAPRAPRYVTSGHESWCANRYRSYRASDNTYQPNSGPRRACVSPY